METMAAFRSPFSALSPDWRNQVDVSWVGSKPVLSKAWIQRKTLVSCRPLGIRRSAIRASIRSSDYGSSSMAPLQLESPVGQFLSQMLMSHPHLVPAAVEQQLELLQTHRSNIAENDKEEEPSASGSEPLLYRRIAEVKANEREKALEGILYTLVVQKFNDANAPLIPNLTPSSPGRVDTWPNEQGKLVQLHSPESYEMIKNHLSHILGDSDDYNTIAQLSKLKVGQVYAASAIYGYFLKRVDQRYQLDKKMKILPNGIGKDDLNSQDDIAGVITSRLKNFVMSFDKETLQRYAKIRSKEAMSIIEKHTAALFGRAKVAVTPQGTCDSSKDENIDISFDDFRRLILEGLTFGSFLWDAESYVDLKCHFLAN